jgi:hypothetical protein
LRIDDSDPCTRSDIAAIAGQDQQLYLIDPHGEEIVVEQATGTHLHSICIVAWSEDEQFLVR